MGKLSLADGPEKVQQAVQDLEDSDSEQNDAGLAQEPQGCLADSDNSEEEAVEEVPDRARSPSPKKAALDEAEDIIDITSGLLRLLIDTVA